LGGSLYPIFGVGVEQNRGLDLMRQGTLHLLCGGDAEDAFQPFVHLTHPVGGRCGQCVQERDRHGHVLTGPGEGGELPLRLLPRHSLDCL
jgi:hypothetical protein